MIQILQNTFIDPWYDKQFRVWYCRYVNKDGHQIGAAWFDRTRDLVLINRPPLDFSN